MKQMKEKIKAFVREHEQDIIRDWKDLVNLEGSWREPKNMYVVAEHLRKLFSDAGVDCGIYCAKPDVPPVLTGVLGADRPGAPVLFSGHFDTVFDKGTFGENPFRIVNGNAYGPGVLDMKGGIIITLYVIKALEELGYADRPIRIAFCGDEENGPEHHIAMDIIKKWAEGCVAAFNMETGPVNGDLCVGRKWGLGGKMTVHGVSAHAGNKYEVGRNAVVEAAYKIIKLQNLTDMELGTHMNPAIVHGGTVVNCIPDTCTLTFSGRFVKQSEIDRVAKACEDMFSKPDVEGTSIEYSFIGPFGGFETTEQIMALWQFVKDICTANGFPEVGHVYLGGGSDASSIALAGTPVLCGCGVRGEWGHTDQEYAVVSSMFERICLWIAVVQAIENFKI